MVFEKVREIICDQLDLEDDQVTMDSTMTHELGADSLDILDLLTSLEEEFEIDMPEDEVENLQTVGELVDYISKISKKI